MKKIILGVVVFSLVFLGAGLAVAQEQNLEKIPSPDHIKDFQVIKKEGGALFGIRKDMMEKSRLDDANMNPAGASSLEKIPSPAEIPFFKKIIKMGTALWGERKDREVRSLYITPAMAPCVKTAIDKKDAAIKTSTTGQANKMVSAIDARNVCQKAAIDQTTAQAQFEANKACVATFQKAVKEANEAFRQEKDAAKKAFREDLKNCQSLNAATSSDKVPFGQLMVEDGD